MAVVGGLLSLRSNAARLLKVRGTAPAPAAQPGRAASSISLRAFGAWAHGVAHPPGNAGPLATFGESLRRTPWKSEAGPDHPLWRTAAAEPDRAEPRSD